MELLTSIRKRSEGLSYKSVTDSVLINFQLRPYPDGLPDPNAPLIDCKFAKQLNNRHILASANDHGKILIQNSLFATNKININDICNNSIFSMDWSNVDMKLVVGCGDHNVSLWDVSNEASMTPISVFKGHNGSVKSVAFKPNHPAIFASAGRDGVINVWDCRNQMRNHQMFPDIHLENTHMYSPLLAQPPESARITSIVFLDDNYLASVADADSYVKVWDLRKSYITRKGNFPTPRFELNSKSKFDRSKNFYGHTRICLNSRRTTLYAHYTDQQITAFDMCSFNPEPVARYHCYTSKDFFLQCAVSPNDEYIACTDSDSKVYIWKVGFPKFPFVCLETGQPGGAGLDWSNDGELKLATCSDFSFPYVWVAEMPTDDDPYENDITFRQKVARAKDELEVFPSACYVEYFMEFFTKNMRRVRKFSTLEKEFVPGSCGELQCLSSLPNYKTDGVYQHHKCPPKVPGRKRANAVSYLSKVSTSRGGKSQRKSCMKETAKPESKKEGYEEYYRNIME